MYGSPWHGIPMCMDCEREPSHQCVAVTYGERRKCPVCFPMFRFLCGYPPRARARVCPGCAPPAPARSPTPLSQLSQLPTPIHSAVRTARTCNESHASHASHTRHEGQVKRAREGTSLPSGAGLRRGARVHGCPPPMAIHGSKGPPHALTGSCGEHATATRTLSHVVVVVSVMSCKP
jgi:hypothetical protein